MTKAEQEEAARQKAWEEEQAKNGGVITLPRSGEPGAPDGPPIADQARPASKSKAPAT